jgi:hypothetical protein
LQSDSERQSDRKCVANGDRERRIDLRWRKRDPHSHGFCGCYLPLEQWRDHAVNHRLAKFDDELFGYGDVIDWMQSQRERQSDGESEPDGVGSGDEICVARARR